MPTWGAMWGQPWGGPLQLDAIMGQILYNEGAQTVRHIPVDAHGRVTRVASAEYSIIDLRESDTSDNRTIQASTAATVDSVTETLTAAAGPGTADPRLLSVPASGVTEGRTYILEEDGQREAFVVHRKDTSNARIWTKTDLRLDWTTSAQIRGVEISGTFPSAEANDEDEVEDGGGPYLVIWDYQINGKAYLVADEVWLSRYSIPPFCTEAYVLEAFPALARSMRGDGPSVTQAIKVAHDDLLSELEASGIDPRYFKSLPYLRNTERKRAIEYLHRWKQTDPDTIEADRWEERYMRAVENLTTGKAPIGTVRIDPANNTAPPGSSEEHGNAWFSKS